MTSAVTKYVVRFYDAFDGWTDVSKPLDQTEAETLASVKTAELAKGNRDMGEYYRAFPENTRMVYTPEFLGR